MAGEERFVYVVSDGDNFVYAVFEKEDEARSFCEDPVNWDVVLNLPAYPYYTYEAWRVR